MPARSYLLLLLLSLALPLAGCPGEVDDDDDATVPDDDDATGDDDDATGDDDDSAGDDDDATGDDDDSSGDDDDSAGDDDDSAGDDDDSAGDDDDSAGDDDDSADPDGDGDGSPASEDCDDADPANFPGNTEVCDGADNDCDSSTWATDEDTDADSDGAVACLDCDDTDGANFPGNPEVCDGADNDCDATTFASGEDTDIDNDGTVTCLDCDDADTNNYPGNTEVCDGADNDCDATTVFAGEDTDGDSDQVITCLDCDDADPDNYPGNTEVCDGADNDCDGTTFATDEDVDADSDQSPLCLDCDDMDPFNFPGNTEVCDGSDNDCNLIIDLASGEDYDLPGTVIDSTLTNATYTETITVSRPGAIEDLDVSIDISHTWNADLDVSLESPSGTVADLFSDVGGSGDDIDIVLDDESSNTLPTSNTTLTGDYQPETDPLSVFDGEIAAGTWTLTVVDDANQDGGTINEWGLFFNLSAAAGPGESQACAMESCDDVIALNSSATDGAYWLDPDFLGAAAQYSCDMTTDNGGWTLVYDWDRVSMGDDATDFQNSFDTWVNGMGAYYDETSNIRWEDANFSYDALYGYAPVDVPNGGEVLHDIYFWGNSMEDSGTWFTAVNSAGDEELYCNDDASGNGNYSGTELGYIPSYTCSQSFVSTETYNPGVVQLALGSEVTGLEITSLMADSGSGDISRLYRYVVWVR